MCNGDALAYCNSYADLVNAFCGGTTCTESARAHCEGHFNNYGRSEIAQGRRYAPNCGSNNKFFTIENEDKAGLSVLTLQFI